MADPPTRCVQPEVMGVLYQEPMSDLAGAWLNVAILLLDVVAWGVVAWLWLL